MTIDWKKFGIWVLVLALGGGLWYTLSAPKVTTDGTIVVVPAPKVEPPKVEPPKVEPPVVETPKPPAPVPETKRKFKPKATFVPRVPNPDARCSLVPDEAYRHPVDVVMAVARRKGVSGEALEILRWCISTAKPVH